MVGSKEGFDKLSDEEKKAFLKSGEEWRENCLEVYESRRSDFDREHFISLVSDFRESLGFEAADTESTFDPWDLVSLPVRENGGSAWYAMWDYWFALKKSFLLPVALLHSPNYPQNYTKSRVKHGQSLFFYGMFQYVFEEEWANAPVYAIDNRVKQNMDTERGWCNTRLINNKEMFFNRLLEDEYSNDITSIDWKALTDAYGSRKKGGYWEISQKHWWFPSIGILFGEKGWSPAFDSAWDFIKQFQQYVYRDESGRYTSRPFKRLDYMVHNKHNHIEWTRSDVREWLFNYVFKHYGVEVNRDTFPDRATDRELEMVINLRSIDMKFIAGNSRVYRSIKEKMDDCGNSILKMVKYAWPNYRMVMSRWSRATAGEKRANVMLERVFAYCCEHYTHGTTTPLLDEEGNKIAYEHLKEAYKVKVDGRSDSLRFAFEVQGDWHFIEERDWIAESGYSPYDETMYYRRHIPTAYLEWCVEEGIEPAESQLQYRQEVLDPLCRQHIEKIGYTPIYLMLSIHSYPVEGVHGDIPIWSGTYVTPEDCPSGHEGRIGLAETFDMQGREDVGDMIRRYYNEVVLA